MRNSFAVLTDFLVNVEVANACSPTLLRRFTT